MQLSLYTNIDTGWGDGSKDFSTCFEHGTLGSTQALLGQLSTMGRDHMYREYHLSTFAYALKTNIKAKTKYTSPIYNVNMCELK